MKFQAPQWLWLLAAGIPLLWLALRDESYRQQRFSRFADRAVWRALVPDWEPLARVRKVWVWLAVFIFLVLALARPQWGSHEETVKTSGLDIMVVFDVSNSMEAEDVVPSRTKKARHLIKTLADRVRGDRLGMVAFAASSYVACPLTTDVDYFVEMLQIMSSKMVTHQGTDVGIGLDTARRALERGAEEVSKGPAGQASEGGSRPASHVVVLVSDGEDQEEGALAAAQLLKGSGIKLYVLGVGTEKGGPIPIRDEGGNLVGYKKDRRGQPIVTSFHPDALMGVAQAAGGRYWNITADESELEEMLRDMGALNRSEYAERRYVVYEERFQWPLAIAVILLILELSLPVRRMRRLAAVFLGALLAVSSPNSFAFSLTDHSSSLNAYLNNEKGLKDFKEGKLGEAQKNFGTAQATDPELPELQFNQGVVQMGQGAVDGAIQAFDDAAKKAKERGNAGIEAQALFNLGGVLAKKGDIPGAVRSYLGSIDSARRSKDSDLETDIRKNLELLIQKRQQQKKEEQQKQDKEKQDEKKQDQQKQDKDKDKDKDKKDKQDEGKQDKDKKFADPSKSGKRQFKSKTLSPEDAERVMAELSNRERELQAKVKKQNGKPEAQENAKDW
ncbi:VWA domain-containing protein [Bdellovibrionota bacterium FG-1]